MTTEIVEFLHGKMEEGPRLSSIQAVRGIKEKQTDLQVIKSKASAGSSSFVLIFDTNFLKFLLPKPLLLNDITEFPGEIFIPGQAYIEYFNNYTVFSELQKQQSFAEFQKIIEKLAKTPEGGNSSLASLVLEELNLDEVVERVKKEAELERNYQPHDVINALMDGENVRIDFVSRVKFSQLANSRATANTPPGWRDANKARGQYGDFWFWADLLYSSLDLLEKNTQPGIDTIFVLISGDNKPDWLTEGNIHPYLASEFHSVTGSHIFKIQPKELDQILNDLTGK